MKRSVRESWVNPLLSTLACGIAGWVFAVLAIPLPWIIGPLCLMAAANFSGVGLRAIPWGRPVGQMAIGAALGLYFTPSVMAALGVHVGVLVAAASLALLLGWVGGWVVRRLSDTDRVTAFFASVPGGAAEMTVLGERFGARADRVALAQSLRVLMVVVIVPFALTYSGISGTDVFAPASVRFDAAGMGQLLAFGTALGVGLWRLGVGNAFMLGPLFATGTLTAGGIELSSIPTPLTNAGQLLIGCALGARFERALLRSLPRFVGAVAVSVLVCLALAGACAFGLASAASVPVSTLLLATAPGGVAEMCITAQVLQLGVPLVTAAQVSRVIILVTLTGPIFTLLRGGGGPPPPSGRGTVVP